MMNHSSSVHVANILLVEDNPGDIRLTREALNHSDYQSRLTVVHDGEHALDYLHRRGRYLDASWPDFIILDLNLPRRTGFEVLAEIKRDSSLKRIPVIIFTSSRSDHEITRSYELHANCFVTKPVGLDRFMKAVHAIERFWVGIVHLPAG